MPDAATASAHDRLAAWIAGRVAASRRPPVIGINGAQGSGKSTLAARLLETLASRHGLRAVAVSIDDFYLPRVERQRLACTQHPLFATRGVPGTHEVALGISTLRALAELGPGQAIPLPVFRKADDDRAEARLWPVVTGPVDVVLFEGWCVGTPPQGAEALLAPCNALEATHDADGRWRRAVDAALAGPYAEWFARLDALVFLRIPSFDCVARWRGQQERETAAAHAGDGAGLMSDERLATFIQHYERLTRHALRTLPARADAVLDLDDAHAVTAIAFSR